MKRDLTLYPQDSNGDVLWELAQQGVDLGKEREIDFPVLFPTEEAALRFAVELLRQGLKASYTPDGDEPSLPWQVTAHVPMVPRHADLLEVVELLEAGATPHGGRPDGWGFYQD